MTQIDKAQVSRLLERVELQTHREGWDKPARLHLIYDTAHRASHRAYQKTIAVSQGQPVRCADTSYAAQSLVSARMFGPGNPAHALFRLAWNLASSTHPVVRGFAAILSQPAFMGLAFTFEGWGRVGTLAERASWGEKAFVDMPGSIESRTVFGTDVNDDTYYISRNRGEPAQDLSAKGCPKGAVVECLATIVAKVAGKPVHPMNGAPRGFNWPEELRRAHVDS